MTRYSAEEREALTLRAVELRAKGKSLAAIADELVSTPKTVKKWIDAEYAKRSEHRTVSDAREQSLARYEMLFRDCVERLELVDKLAANGSSAAGYINAARGLLERMDKLTGAEAPIKHQEVEDEIVIEWEDLDGIGPAAEG